MTLGTLLIIGAALIGAWVIMLGVGRTERTSIHMLEHYAELLAEARCNAEHEHKEPPANEPPAATLHSP